jgi:photosystem II stability/assembly factor-like uncharacterized protein
MTLCCFSAISSADGETPLPTPRPALTAPKAVDNRLLDLAVAGERLVAVGEQGVILISDDARTWQQVASPVDVMLTRVRFRDAQQGWALGYDATMLQTQDGGNSWTLRHHDPKGRALYDLIFLDAQRALATGAYGSLLETPDGGRTWTARETDVGALGMHLNAILRLGDGSLLLAGERGLMARSVDDGARWQMLDFPYAGSIFGALPRGEKGVLVYGMRGNLFETADLSACAAMDLAAWDPYTRENREDPAQIAARGWRRLDNPTRESLFGALPQERDTLLVGVNGTVLRLHDSDLAPVPVPARESLTRLVAFKGHLIAVGKRGIQDLGAQR